MKRFLLALAIAPVVCAGTTPQVDYTLRSGTVFTTVDGKEVAYSYDLSLLGKHANWDVSEPLPNEIRAYHQVALSAIERITRLDGWRVTGYQVRRPAKEIPFIVTVFLQNEKKSGLIAHVPVALSLDELPYQITEKKEK